MDGDRVERELARLRDDLYEYRQSSKQSNLDRRVENIQILIALAVVGASISIYSSQVIQTPFWQELLISSYWTIVLSIFIFANTLFLILKLLTIPLQQISNNSILSYVHDTIEPFLYFFAVAGAVSAVTVGGILAVTQPDLTQNALSFLAIVSLSLPFLSAMLYAYAYRWTVFLEQYQEVLLEINRTFSLFVTIGAMTAEEQSQVIRQIAILLLPIPSILSMRLIRLTRVVARKFGLASTQFISNIENSNRLLNDYLDRILTDVRYPYGTTNWLMIWSDVAGSQNEEKQLSREDGRKLVSELAEIRNKAAHEQLDDGDIDRIREILNRYDIELDSEEESDTEDCVE